MLIVHTSLDLNRPNYLTKEVADQAHLNLFITLLELDEKTMSSTAIESKRNSRLCKQK